MTPFQSRKQQTNASRKKNTFFVIIDNYCEYYVVEGTRNWRPAEVLQQISDQKKIFEYRLSGDVQVSSIKHFCVSFYFISHYTQITQNNKHSLYLLTSIDIDTIINATRNCAVFETVRYGDTGKRVQLFDSYDTRYIIQGI